MKFKTINPATGAALQEYDYLDETALKAKIDAAQTAYNTWKHTTLTERTALLSRLSDIILAQKDKLASLATQEMGKRTADAQAEVEKSALVCRHYAEHGAQLLQEQVVVTEASKSYVSFAPLGITLAVMPWNFPYWQVFRAAVPALLAGNSMLLKHASVVPGCALAIEALFTQAGAPAGLFQTLLVSGSQVETIIADPRVRLVSLTGSEPAGVSVGRLAGQHLKRSVLELGGSDPFVVFGDADLDLAVSTATTARLIVAGQSCIAAKRFIVHDSIHDAFVAKFKELLAAKVVGDPKDPKTDVGPLVNLEAVETIQKQVDASVAAGATLITGGHKLDQRGFFYPPTLLTGVKPGMAAFDEETFGPVATVSTFNTIVEALSLANHPHFGLGASVWTSDEAIKDTMIKGLEVGSVFVNSMVKSDPRLPFGGTKFSGYGRELGSFGLYEFCNIKTVWVT